MAKREYLPIETKVIGNKESIAENLESHFEANPELAQSIETRLHYFPESEHDRPPCRYVDIIDWYFEKVIELDIDKFKESPFVKYLFKISEDSDSVEEALNVLEVNLFSQEEAVLKEIWVNFLATPIGLNEDSISIKDLLAGGLQHYILKNLSIKPMLAKEIEAKIQFFGSQWRKENEEEAYQISLKGVAKAKEVAAPRKWKDNVREFITLNYELGTSRKEIISLLEYEFKIKASKSALINMELYYGINYSLMNIKADRRSFIVQSIREYLNTFRSRNEAVEIISNKFGLTNRTAHRYLSQAGWKYEFAWKTEMNVDSNDTYEDLVRDIDRSGVVGKAAYDLFLEKTGLTSEQLSKTAYLNRVYALRAKESE